MKNNKLFYNRFLIVAIPIFFQQLFMSSLNLIDGVMIGRIVDSSGSANNAINAVGLANQPFFLLFMIIISISSGASIFAAQFWGKEKIEEIRKILGICITCTLIVSFIFTILALFFPEQILSLYPANNTIITAGIVYFSITGISYIPMALTVSFSSILRSIEDAKLPFIINCFAVILNAVLNYLLIYGKFGFPVMGIRGAAIATCTSRIIEAILIITITYVKKSPLAGKVSEIFSFNFTIIIKYFKISLPMIISETAWVLGDLVYNFLYIKKGVEAFAAITAFNHLAGLFFIGFVAIAESSITIVGNRIGANENKNAAVYAKYFVYLSLICTGLVSMVMFFSRDILSVFFKLSNNSQFYFKQIIIVYSLLLGFKALNYLFINGIFRGGGDTFFSFKLEICTVWVIGIPIGLISVLYFNLTIYQVFLLINIEEIVKTIFCLYRFKTRKWIKKLSFE